MALNDLCRGQFIAKAKRNRKLFGGGMRQAGVIAAAALYAVENQFDRLKEDHRNAQILAQAINDTPGLQLECAQVETNLVWFEINPDLGTSKDFAARLKEKGILVSAMGSHTLRACTHLDVSTAQCEQAAECFKKVVAGAVISR